MKLAMAMPCAGPVDPRVVQSVGNLCYFTGAKGVAMQMLDANAAAFTFGITMRTLVDDARNWLARAFVEHTDADYCFWMDSDMTFQPDAALGLLHFAEQNKAPLVSGIYYQRVGQPFHKDAEGKAIPCGQCGYVTKTHPPTVWRQDPVIKDREGKQITREYEDEYLHHFIFPTNVKVPFRAHVVGFGCMLTHRSVFEKLKYPWFDFLRMPSGKKCSEDFYFFTQARKAGIPLWVVPKITCGHIADGEIITEANCLVDPNKMGEVQLETIQVKTVDESAFHLVEIKTPPTDKSVA